MNLKEHYACRKNDQFKTDHKKIILILYVAREKRFFCTFTSKLSEWGNQSALKKLTSHKNSNKFHRTMLIVPHNIFSKNENRLKPQYYRYKLSNTCYRHEIPRIIIFYAKPMKYEALRETVKS